MNSFSKDDWERSALRTSSIADPYLMGTGVVTAEDTSGRPISPPHSHPDAMLAWCYRGTVWVHLQDARWRLAPGQGVWIPPFTPHTAHHEPGSTGCYTYIPDSHFATPPAAVSQAYLPRAVQEMLLHLGINDMPTDLRVRIQSVLIEMLQLPAPALNDEWTEVPMPTDERVRPLMQAVLADPGDPRTVRELLAAHGLHERTVLRIFQHDTGMSFSRWRTGVRMTLAARLIVDGLPIGSAAARCGYATASAFSASFKERFGLTPREYLLRTQADTAQHLYWR
ncbi:AraC family transcriptional regulator [Leucobacter sp. UT-8R-CII-1-4]|uniref:helix-turn-helix transcriptional regulator n=1 Tax=Leucobacter sp. UT-8R-CII-1-4 TaxID=3040075 RepID=UPI0024A8CD3B|nr:AraC family transcriptional regulator [Leucobacter sp. UT-8R-CII-1-4]MDI6022139.1 AraC family transcriptional regulator [Leucobacter sp. UT-8R-CII-1-4]